MSFYVFVFFLPEISAHSGDVKLYLPSMIFLSITICFRCQNGGQPTNNVNIITPHAHLILKKPNKTFHKYEIQCRTHINRKHASILTHQLLLNIRVIFPTYYILMFRAPNIQVFHKDLNKFKIIIIIILLAPKQRKT